MTDEQKLDMGRRVVKAMVRLDRVGALPNDLDVEGWVDIDGDPRSAGLHAPWVRHGENALDLPDVTRAATRGVLRGVLVALCAALPLVSEASEPAALVRALELAADRLAPPLVSDELAAALASGASPDRPLLDRVLAALREVGR